MVKSGVMQHAISGIIQLRSTHAAGERSLQHVHVTVYHRNQTDSENFGERERGKKTYSTECRPVMTSIDIIIPLTFPITQSLYKQK